LLALGVENVEINTGRSRHEAQSQNLE
jgi:hypothetical protein